MWILKGISIGLAMVILEFVIFNFVKFGYLVATRKQTWMTTVGPIGDLWFWVALVTTVTLACWFFKTRAA